ncbi:MAG: ABC transporter substrate-binding protein [Acidobacteriota bacterium]|nr:ABC transporter substrate-binding protein [Acidobacteriota bacterium]
MGSKNFTEQVILGEIIAQHLERSLHLKVNRKLNLGGTLLAHQALLDRDLDMYPEYTGTAFTNVLKQEPISDASVVLDRVRSQYLSTMQLQWMDPLGFNNSFAIGVSGADARAHHLTTLTDGANYAPGFALGAGYEFMQRPDGYGTLNAAYPIHWTASPKTMDLGLLYTALQQKQVSMIAGSTTDAMLVVQDVKVLQDDKHAFPPYQACVVVRSSSLTATPGLKESLAQLSGKISDDVMRKMNYEVDGKHRQVADVAKEFLDSLK